MGLNPSPAYIGGNNFQNDVATDRVLVATLLGAGRNLGGVMSLNDFVITPVGGSHTATVSAGKAFIPERTAPVTRGGYFAYSDGNPVDTIVLPAAQAQGFYATVLLRVADPTLGTVTGTQGVRFDILSGAVGSSPSPLSDVSIDATYGVPGGWLRLYDILINSVDTGAVPAGQFSSTRSIIDPISKSGSMIRLKAGVDNPGFGSGVYTGQVFSLDYQKGDPAVFSVSGGAVIVNVAGIYTCDLEITTSGGGPIEAKLSTQYISKICGSTSPTVDGTLNAATTRYFVAGTSVSAAVYNFGGVTTIMADSTNNPCGFSVVRIPNS